MTEASSTSTPPVATATSAFPFAPLTLDGLGILIEQHASRVTYAVASHRATDPVVVAEAGLVFDMCRARTNRVLGLVREIRGAA